jgi:hypothetical protein
MKPALFSYERASDLEDGVDSSAGTAVKGRRGTLTTALAEDEVVAEPTRPRRCWSAIGSTKGSPERRPRRLSATSRHRRTCT